MTAIVAERITLRGAENIGRSSVLVALEDVENVGATGVELLFDHMRITEIELPAISFTTGDARSDPDYVTLYFVLEGSFTVYYEQHTLRFMAGSAAFLVGGASIAAHSKARARVASIRLRRDELVGRGVRLERGFCSFAYSAAQFSPVLPYLLDLVARATHTRVEAEPVEASLLRLITGLFAEDRDCYGAC